MIFHSGKEEEQEAETEEGADDEGIQAEQIEVGYHYSSCFATDLEN